MVGPAWKVLRVPKPGQQNKILRFHLLSSCAQKKHSDYIVCELFIRLLFHKLFQLHHFWESTPLRQIPGFSFSLHLNIWSLPPFDWRTSGVKKGKLGSFQPQRGRHTTTLLWAFLLCGQPVLHHSQHCKQSDIIKGSVSAVKEKTDHTNMGIY